MKLEGPLSPAAFASLAAGFDNRAVAGMEPQNARYLRPRHIRHLTRAGLLPASMPAPLEAVVCHYVRLRSARGELSRRLHTLLVLFLPDVGFAIFVLPTDWFLAGADGADGEDAEEEKPKTRQCSYDICFTRGSVSTCETQVITVPESETCPDPNTGCPNSACSAPNGSSFDVDTILQS